MSTNGQRTVVMTGASGVVGRAVAAELEGCRIVGLVHADRDVPDVDEVIECDVREPRLGLDPETWERLVDEADSVVHSAALTNWGKPYEQYQAINVDGTRRVAELAALAGAPLHYISTCFVNALLEHGHDALSEGNVIDPYVRSKLAAERVLDEVGVPHTVFRPTNLVGESGTGASYRPQIVLSIGRWICRGKAPYFPAHPGNLVDVVPLDVLAVAMARAVERDDVGRELWVTYGARAMSLDDALDVLVEHAADRGRDIGRAPIVDPREPLPIPLEEVSPTSRSFVSTLVDVSEVTHLSGGVLPSSLDELIERYDVPEASDAEALRLSLEFWAGGRSAAGAVTQEAT
jgi:nucleoside-diphosphate-sugar epimerase